MTSSVLRPAAVIRENKIKGGKSLCLIWIAVHSLAPPLSGGVAAAVLAASSAVAAGQSGYFVIAEIVSKKDKADDLRALLVPFAELSAKEPGCLVYTLMEVIGEPGRFLTFERWTDKAALGVHMTTPHIKEIVPKLEPVLAKPFTQLFLDARTGG